MEKVTWKVDGMTCANCALTINKFLEKQGNFKNSQDFELKENGTLIM